MIKVWLCVLIFTNPWSDGGTSTQVVQVRDKDSCERLGQRAVIAGRALNQGSRHLQAIYSCTEVLK